MKLLRCSVTNFASYPKLEFNFQDLGLALVYGPTGSGKSTLMDVACWAIFGTTAKDGNVDEVRAWQSPGEPTQGTIVIQLPTETLTVTRIRGKASQNDLYFTSDLSPDRIERGRDLSETQKLLEKRLGFTSEQYIAAAYMHEFSPTAAFFTAKAKDRRALFERIADFRLPGRISAGSAAHRKAVRESLASARESLRGAESRVKELERSRRSTSASLQAWEITQAATLKSLESKAKNFEKETADAARAVAQKHEAYEAEREAQVDALIAQLQAFESTLLPDEEYASRIASLKESSRCDTCGSLPDSANEEINALMVGRTQNANIIKRMEDGKKQLEKVSEAKNPYADQLERKTQNTYLEQLETERTKANPFTSVWKQSEVDLKEAQSDLSAATQEAARLDQRLQALQRIYDLSFCLRAELLKKAISEIETETNRCLEEYFDAEMRVSFALDGDDLDVSIQKSGYECVYRQLSKGQRGLLKLCFSVSVMRAVANSAGVHFDTIFLDEALDGLDADLKVKAYRLFEELEKDHESVLVIEHSTELREQFSKRFSVTLSGDSSSVEDDSA